MIRLGQSDPPVSSFTEDSKADYRGQRILPGLHDSHIHVSSIGKALLAIDLKGCQSIEEFQKRIKDYAEKNPKVSVTIMLLFSEIDVVDSCYYDTAKLY